MRSRRMSPGVASSPNRCARSGGSCARSKPRAAASRSASARSSAWICSTRSRGRAASSVQHLLVRHAQRLGEHGAQALVPGHQVAERQLQGSDVEIAHKPHRQRDRVGRVRAFEPIEEPQPALRERQRDLRRPRHRPQRCARALAVAQPRRQARDRRGLEQAADREFDVERGTDAADQPCGEQRMAAELEEVVVDADLGKSQASRRTARTAPPPAALRGSRRVAFAVTTGAGSARRSSLPFGVSGSRSSSTKADGTM